MHAAEFRPGQEVPTLVWPGVSRLVGKLKGWAVDLWAKAGEHAAEARLAVDVAGPPAA